MSTKMKAAITVLFLIYGVIIGINLEPDRTSEQSNVYLSISSDTNVQEVTDLLRANEDMRQRIVLLQRDIESLESERAESNVTLQILMRDVQMYQMLAGHKDVQGPGIYIQLEGIFEENIAPLVFQRKYLITLVNELRSNSAEVISINGQRITARSEIALAGNHIQINGRPVAPQYHIQAIGNVDEFKRYVAFRTFIFELMEGDGVTASIEFRDDLVIDRPHREKAIQFLQITR